MPVIVHQWTSIRINENRWASMNSMINQQKSMINLWRNDENICQRPVNCATDSVTTLAWRQIHIRLVSPWACEPLACEPWACEAARVAKAAKEIARLDSNCWLEKCFGSKCLGLLRAHFCTTRTHCCMCQVSQNNVFYQSFCISQDSQAQGSQCRWSEIGQFTQ